MLIPNYYLIKANKTSQGKYYIAKELKKKLLKKKINFNISSKKNTMFNEDELDLLKSTYCREFFCVDKKL